MRKKLLRFLRIAPVAFLFASVAMAQTTGTIIGVVTDASTGKPVEGAVVIATSPNLQGEQTAVTGKDGSYRITLLPPGQYKLSVQVASYQPGQRSDIRLGLDKTLRANLTVVPEAVTLEEQVVKTGTQTPIINVGSAETGQVISKEFVAAIPVGRSFDAVAITVPGASADALGVGFSGGQSLDNAYILDGLNVADPVYAGNASTLLTNFTEEIDIKTGSFSAEYGRATGGVVNVVTKSGSNEFHGSVFSTLRPDWLVKPNGIPAGTNGYSVWTQEKPGNGSYYTDFGFEVGGPIKKDKLWFFLGFAPQFATGSTERYIRATAFNPTATDPTFGTAGARITDAAGNYLYTEVPGSRRKIKPTATTYQYTGKLTYLINENNTLSVAGYGNIDKNHNFLRATGTAATTFQDFSSNVIDVNARYAGKFLQKKLIIEGAAGVHRQFLENNPLTTDITLADGSTVTVSQRTDSLVRHALNNHFWNLGTFEPTSSLCQMPGATASNVCYVATYWTGGYGFLNLGETATRYAGKVSASYLATAAGSHNFKAGVDIERNYYDLKKAWSGTARYDYYDTDGGFAMVRSYGTVRGGATNSVNPANVSLIDVNSAKTVTQSNAFYAQDSWQVLDTGLTVNAGLRWETQSMQDNTSADSPKLSINDNIAPRLAVIYDPTRTGRSKISANWGRYYEMIPLDMAGRAFGSEKQVQLLYGDGSAGGSATCTTPYVPSGKPFNPRNNGCAISPTGGGWYGIIDINGAIRNVAQIGGVSPVAPDLKGMFVDQFGAAFEYELLSDLSLGVTYEGRRLGRAIEDMSSNDGASYFIANPGESKPWTYTFADYNSTQTLDPKGVMATDALTGRRYLAPFPKPKRDYDGITFKVAKNFSRGWQGQASYTWSLLQGNYDGLYNTANGQQDPNISSQYDLPGLMPNRVGPLNGDHTHTVKIYGSYTWNPTQRFSLTSGVGYTGRSGYPISYLGGHPVYGANEAYVLPRGIGGRSPFTNQVDLRGNFEYQIKAPYAIRLTVDLFNVLNDQTAVQLDEQWTASAILPIQGSTCNAKNAAGKSDPISAARADCPDLRYLRTIDGRVPTVNSNWGRPIASTAAFQAARSLRLGLALTF